MNLLFFMITIIYLYYAYLIFKNKENKMKKISYIVLFFISLIIVKLTFYKLLDINGDNAYYMSFAKSLIEKFGMYTISGFEIRNDSYYPIGLPLLLSPIYLLFGFDIIKMKIFIALIFFASIIFFYKIIKNYTNEKISILLTLIYATHPLVIQFSSMIMTEIPYIFFSLLSIFSAHKYDKEKKSIMTIWFFILIVSVYMTYMTRAIGIGMFGGIVLYYFFKIKPLKVVKKIFDKNFDFIKTIEVKKFISIFIALLTVFILWQIRGKLAGGSSQLEMFLNSNFLEILKKFSVSFWQVIAQNLFAYKIIKWQLNFNQILLLIINIIIIIGFLKSIINKELISLYFFVTLIIFMLGSVQTGIMFVSRFSIPFIPMYIYFFYLGINKILRKMRLKVLVSFIIMFFVLISNFIGLNYLSKNNNIEEYPYSVNNYYNCVLWIKNNIKEDVLVLSRKPAFTYVVSGKKSENLTYNSNKIYSKEWCEKQLEYMKKHNVDYLILDGFTSSTAVNVLPIVQNNPNKFSIINVFGSKSATYLLKLNKWW